ncbi:MAG: hypothetical protein DI539_00020 [Flavobacterium psychrophilum]|nr:MAG: hypothetical protein DI539_00020 [Flavobacterium psychrophilum]
MLYRKLFALFILLCTCTCVQGYAQKRVTDREKNTAIPYAHILLDNKIYSYTDEDGQFKIAATQKFDTITISHLSYETLSLSHTDYLNSDTFTLHEKTTVLNELSITNSKRKRKTETLLPEKTLRDKLYSKDNHRLVYETGISKREQGTAANKILISKAVYVPNRKQTENAVIKKIILTSNPKKKQDNEPYAPFLVNLMTFDTINNIPGKKIFTRDLTAGKRRGETVIIDLSKEELVTFPKEGICVVVSVYDTLYYTEIGNMTPPAFKPTLIPNSSSFREYSFGLSGNYWDEASYSKERIQCLGFGIEIEY